MTVVCARCQRYLGTKPPFRDGTVEHGLCAPCALRECRELSTLVLSRERAGLLPLLEGLFRGPGEVRLVVDRRRGDRRLTRMDVDASRRDDARERRRQQTLRIV